MQRVVNGWQKSISNKRLNHQQSFHPFTREESPDLRCCKRGLKCTSSIRVKRAGGVADSIATLTLVRRRAREGTERVVCQS
jgi:hypothetical protein